MISPFLVSAAVAKKADNTIEESRAVDCGGIFEDVKELRIQSPGWPYHLYPENARCVWELSNACATHFWFTPLEFELEQHKHCANDFLKFIYPDSHHTKIEKFCGTEGQKIHSVV